MSARGKLIRLRDSAPAILPSLLLCDFGALADEVRRLEDAGAAAMHLDVMDGRFVPNLTYGMPIVEACRKATDLPLDVHLMIDEPEKYLTRFVEAGADSITFHIEAATDPRPLLEKLREADVGAGVALNPATPLESVAEFLGQCDLLLAMSVEPGFGGQTFEPAALDKLRAARELAGDDLLLEVDGGVNRDTISSCAAAGAQLFVAGSAIFRSEDYRAAIESLAGPARSALKV